MRLPPTLLARFTLVSLTVTVLVGVGFTWVISDRMVESAIVGASRDTAGLIDRTIMPQIRAADFRSPTAVRVAEWRSRLTRVVGSLDIVSVKVWNARGQVVYADKRALIGRTFPLPDDLRRVLRGETVHRTRGLERSADPAERAYGLLLETYVPAVVTGTDVPVGVLEVHRSMASVLDEIRTIKRVILGGAAAAFAVLYAALFAIISGASRQLSRLASFPELAPNPVVETDLRGRVTYVNPEAVRLFPDLRSLKARHPLLADLPVIAGEFRDTQERSVVREVKVGSRHYQLSAYMATRRLIRWYVIDVTDRKRALDEVRTLNAQLEQRVADRTAELHQARAFLEHLIATSPGVIFRLNVRDFRAAYVSGNALEVLGYRPEEVVGLDGWWTEHIHPDDRDQVLGKLARAASSALAETQVEYRFFHKRRRHIWLHTRFRIERDTAGNAVSLLGYALDVTDRRTAEEAIRRAQLEAERANLAKNEFISRMSHELRTPLNAILGFAQLLEMDSLSEEHQDSVQYILKGGHHLLELINEVLDIARIESGRVDLSLEAVSVDLVVREAVDLIRPQAAQRGISLAIDLDEADWHIQADTHRLKQVLLNLLSNAVKYNRDAGKVIVTADPVFGSRLRIKVADTGRGIPQEKLGQLFTPFARLGAEQTGVEGTGIGLALSKRLVEAMGGEIGVESQAGQGSTFWVEFPLADVHIRRAVPDGGAPLPSPMPIEGSVLPRASQRRLRTVVLIEDNLANLELVQRLLSARPDIKLLPAMQGRLGLELIQQHRPDLVFLDLVLPDMPGEEILRRLAAEPALRQIPVVVLTPPDMTQTAQDLLLSVGAHHLLSKPLDVNRFLTLVDDSLALAS